MEFTSTAVMNCLYWITSLHENEQGVTRRILEDLQNVAKQCGLPMKQYSPGSAQELLSALDHIAAEARAGMFPMIHLDTHGLAKNGIFVAETKEYVSWEAVAEKLRVINRIVSNNLCVMSHACFSFSVVKTIKINDVSPFFILLAPEQEITAGDIEDNTVGFYKSLLEGLDILSAKAQWFPNQLRTFNCEQMLATALARYINDATIGKQGDRRKEHLVTMAVERGVIANRKNLRAIRKIAKQHLKPTEDLLERFIPNFLAGKRPNFTISELKVMVEQAKHNSDL